MTAALSFGMIFEAINAAVDPDQPATIHGDTITSWRDFDRRTNAIAAAGPLFTAPPEILAFIYVEHFSEEYPFPLIVGAEPPHELLDAARQYWIDIPMVVYVRS